MKKIQIISFKASCHPGITQFATANIRKVISGKWLGESCSYGCFEYLLLYINQRISNIKINNFMKI